MAIVVEDLFQSLLTGNKIEASDIDDLINNKTPEGQFLDYKNGLLLSNNREASAVIREYVSAFANSMGGILIIGVDGDNWCVSGCPPTIGNTELDRWAARCLTPIAHQLVPPPRIQVVDHPSGSILVIVVDRSIGLVQVLHQGRIVYYLRNHEQTIQAPDYLVSDLVLGRRDRPNIHISTISTQGLSTHREPEIYSIHLSLDIITENTGFTLADEIQIGMIYWSSSEEMQNIIGLALGSYIDIKRTDARLNEYFLLQHDRIFIGKLRALEADRKKSGFRIDLPITYKFNWYDYTWQAAMYLIALNTPPIWYQIEIDVNHKFLNSALGAKKLIFNEDNNIRYTRITNTLLNVAIINIDMAAA